jgi:hypothetical protein
MGPLNHNVPLTSGGLDALRAIAVRLAELGHPQPQWMIVEQRLENELKQCFGHDVEARQCETQ